MNPVKEILLPCPDHELQKSRSGRKKKTEWDNFQRESDGQNWFTFIYKS